MGTHGEGYKRKEVLGGVGLATPQPPSFAPGGLVLLLWGRDSIWANPATYLMLDDLSSSSYAWIDICDV